ncbi:hypothetical protein GCM10027085_43350 [Spirosoma aerophilum]
MGQFIEEGFFGAKKANRVVREMPKEDFLQDESKIDRPIDNTDDSVRQHNN